MSSPLHTGARPAVSATALHTRVARPSCPWRAGAPAGTGERGPSLAKERLEVRAAILLTYLLTYSLTYLLTYCAPCCLPRGAHRRANTPTRRSTLRHLDSSSTASAQTRSPRCATDSTMWSPALRTALYAHLYAQRMQRHDRGRSPSGASANPLPSGGETAVSVQCFVEDGFSRDVCWFVFSHHVC